MTEPRRPQGLTLAVGRLRLVGFDQPGQAPDQVSARDGLMRELAMLARRHGLPTRLADGGSTLRLDLLRIAVGPSDDLPAALRRAALSLFETMHGRPMDPGKGEQA
jgi:hypothetical protein